MSDIHSRAREVEKAIANLSPEEKTKLGADVALLFKSVKWGTDFENPKQGSVIITKNEVDAIDEYTKNTT